MLENNKNYVWGPDWCGSVGWASSRDLKGCQFDSRSGQVPGLQVRSWVGAGRGAADDISLSH